MGRSDFEAARTAAREALDIEPASQGALAIEAAAQRRLEDMLAAAATPGEGLASAIATGPRGEDAGAAVLSSTRVGRNRRETFARRAWRRMTRHERLVAAAVTIAIAAIGLPVLTVSLLRPAVPPSGVLVLDAVPWARVEAITAEDGSRVTLARDAATPLSVALPAGSYRVVLIGPPPGGESRELRVRVHAQQTLVAPIERFPSLTPEEYFERYLAGDGPPGYEP
jgi:hypothetical protein